RERALVGDRRADDGVPVGADAVARAAEGAPGQITQAQERAVDSGVAEGLGARIGFALAGEDHAVGGDAAGRGTGRARRPAGEIAQAGEGGLGEGAGCRAHKGRAERQPQRNKSWVSSGHGSASGAHDTWGAWEARMKTLRKRPCGGGRWSAFRAPEARRRPE